MHVPFFKPSITKEEIDNVVSVLQSGWLTTGKICQQFENDFSQFLNLPYCIAANSATAALHLSIIASGIKAGDAVLVPTMTFSSTAEVLYYQNIKPILVDCNLEDLTLSIQDAKEKILKAKKNGIQVRGIMPVHYAGKMAKMDLIEELAEEFNLIIIEDAAHCCGSSYFSKKYKKFLNKSPKSLTQCYSFYCNKCITTCGEGGMVVTENPNIAEKIRCLSLHGLSTNAWDRFAKKGNIFYDIQCVGYKDNLTDIAAAMGCVQLKKAKYFQEKRTQAVNIYKELLKDNPYIKFLEDEPDLYKHSYHLFVIRLLLKGTSLNRNFILQELKNQDIIPSVHWKPLHMHSFYQNQGYSNEDFPNASQAFDEILSLPLFADITQEQIEYVVTTLNKLLNV